MQCITENLHNVYQIITLYTLNVICQLDLNKARTMTTKNTPELVSLQFYRKLFWKVFESTIPHFHQPSTKTQEVVKGRERDKFPSPMWPHLFFVSCMKQKLSISNALM